MFRLTPMSFNNKTCYTRALLGLAIHYRVQASYPLNSLPEDEFRDEAQGCPPAIFSSIRFEWGPDVYIKSTLQGLSKNGSSSKAESSHPNQALPPWASHQEVRRVLRQVSPGLWQKYRLSRTKRSIKNMFPYVYGKFWCQMSRRVWFCA